MQRQVIAPRADLAQKLEAQGLSFHARDGYWKEDVCYRFDLRQVESDLRLKSTREMVE